MPDGQPGGRGKVLAIDFGLRRVGIAVSDALRLLAHSRETFHYTSRQTLLEHLRAMVEAEEVTEIVVGWPRRLDGTVGGMAEEVRRFAKALAGKVTVPVICWDERLTSKQAERVLKNGGVAYSRSKSKVDQLAAVFILQSYLDSRTDPPCPSE